MHPYYAAFFIFINSRKLLTRRRAELAEGIARDGVQHRRL